MRRPSETARQKRERLQAAMWETRRSLLVTIADRLGITPPSGRVAVLRDIIATAERCLTIAEDEAGESLRNAARAVRP